MGLISRVSSRTYRVQLSVTIFQVLFSKIQKSFSIMSSNYSRSRSRSRTRSRSRSNERRDRRSPARRSRSPRREQKEHKQNDTPSKVIGIFGMSFRTEERTIRKEFGRFGEVERVQLIWNHQDNRSKGFAFIYMADIEDAKDAVKELNGKEIDGREVRVDFSFTKEGHRNNDGGQRRYNDGGPRRFNNNGRDFGRGPPRDMNRSYNNNNGSRDYGRNDRRDDRGGRDSYRRRSRSRSNDRRRNRSRSPQDRRRY